MYLVDDAKMWWQARYKEIEEGMITLTSWTDFKRILKDHFYPENTEFVAQRKLEEVKHTKSIRDYVREFSACMLEITEITETNMTFEFVNGLKRWAQKEVMRQNPKTLSSAISAAERLLDFHGEREVP
ncbi:uncharacterized protein LOC141629908 [Silene latifolia]|uniref:uncharacterized protein LOC141629908 n=1 Tax=Silene latifolia TaxID=37657 RepID=UPI003D77B1FC